MNIHFFNRKTKAIETEKVLGGGAVNWAYQNSIGKTLTDQIFAKSWVSRLMGVYEDSALSRRQIQPFIEQYQIDMSEFEPGPYSTFNQFFIRKFLPGKRPFDSSETAFAAGAEARYLAFENIQARDRFYVKGIEIHLEELLRNQRMAEDFEGGTLIIARLCPVDYHRFHFPVSGQLELFQRIPGELHSVNPVALASKPDIFLKNERHLTVYRHPQLGRIAMLEVGALGVGKIIQSWEPNSNRFVKGQEKGYFLFGGSTVIWLLQRTGFKLAEDIRQNSAQGLETWVALGDRLGELT